MKKPTKSFEIALSAVACAFAAGFLMLGSLNPYLLATGYLIAVFALMIPLAKDFVWGAALCYLAAGLLALPLCLWKTVPYFVFFGLHPIVNYLQKKYVKSSLGRILCHIVKTVWFVFAMWLSYFVLSSMAGLVFPEWVAQFLYYVIFIGGTLVFFVYDPLIFACQSSMEAILRRLHR